MLTAGELGAVSSTVPVSNAGFATSSGQASLPDDDPILAQVRHAISDGYAGVVLSGNPGTGKSRHAMLVADRLADDVERRRVSVQFHASYQYEDFVEGYVAEGRAFVRRPRVFSQLCADASEDPDNLHVLLIDEISRADVSRVFGEALTYLEQDKRDISFTLASGTELIVPRNLFLVATMNPWDRGVDELDVALERRFAFIDVRPSSVALRAILEKNGMSPGLIDQVVGFFEFLQQLKNERCHLGHGYFVHARDEGSLRRTWDLQLAHVLRRACQSAPDTFSQIEQRWQQITPSATPESPT